jgi:uncharacterized membrane protein
MTPTAPRSLRLILLASLGLNLMLATWLIAHAPWRHPPGGRHAPVPQLVDLRAFRKALPPERQGVVDTAFATHRPALRERIGALFAARREVRDAIRAEPFDPAALDAGFARLRSAEAEAASQAQRVLGEVLMQLTPQERAQLADLVPRRGLHRREERRESRHERAAPEAGTP